MENSLIEWTHHTFNAWWGCVKDSVECQHCYALQWAKGPYGFGFKNEQGEFNAFPLWGPNAPRRVMSRSYYQAPLKWDKAAGRDGVRRRVFVGSMMDIFEDYAPAIPKGIPDELRDKVTFDIDPLRKHVFSLIPGSNRP